MMILRNDDHLFQCRSFLHSTGEATNLLHVYMRVKNIAAFDGWDLLMPSGGAFRKQRPILFDGDEGDFCSRPRKDNSQEESKENEKNRRRRGEWPSSAYPEVSSFLFDQAEEVETN